MIYGGGTHAAIWIGDWRVVSALNPRQGIRITRLHALGDRFTTFIHTHLSGAASPVRHHAHRARPHRVVATHRVNVRAGHSTHTRVVAVATRGPPVRRDGHRASPRLPLVPGLLPGSRSLGLGGPDPGRLTGARSAVHPTPGPPGPGVEAISRPAVESRALTMR